jgi:hypothetical protein
MRVNRFRGARLGALVSALVTPVRALAAVTNRSVYYLSFSADRAELRF